MVLGSLPQRLRLSSFPVTQIRADSSSPLDVILPVQYFHVVVLQSQVRETKPAAGREGKPGAESEIQTGLSQGVFTLYWAILLKEALSSGQVAGCFTEPGHGIQIYLPPQKMTQEFAPYTEEVHSGDAGGLRKASTRCLGCTSCL